MTSSVTRSSNIGVDSFTCLFRRIEEAINTWMAGGRARVPEAVTERYAVERIGTHYEAMLK